MSDLMLVFVLLRPDDDPFLVLVLIFVLFMIMVSSLVLLLILRPNADHGPCTGPGTDSLN